MNSRLSFDLSTGIYTIYIHKYINTYIHTYIHTYIKCKNYI